MNDSRPNSNSQIHRDEQPDTLSSDSPDTDADWFALIEPEIDVPPKYANEGNVVDIAKQHVEQVVERTEMDVNLNQITWRATRELSAVHGYHRENFVKLSLCSLETNGWQRLMKTVRHELVHIWQYQNDMYDQAGNNTWERAHGSSFERWIPVLNIKKRGGRIQTKKRGEKIFLYNQTVASQSDDEEEEPRTRLLQDFTGIGDTTARELSEDIHRIEELLDVETGTLTDEVQSAVSAQYHDSLQDEVRDWYQKAIRSRSEDDLDPVDRKCLTHDLDWTNSLDDVDVTGDRQSMCQLFRNVSEPDDQLRITIDTHGEFTVQITDIRYGEKIIVDVQIEPTSTPLGPNGTIKVPAPYRDEYPVYCYTREVKDSDAFRMDSISSDLVKKPRQNKITKVDRRE